MTAQEPIDERIDAWRRLLDDGPFEDLQGALDEVVAALDEERLPLQRAIDVYELGVAIATRCSRILDEATLRVERIDATAIAPATDEDLASALFDEDDGDADDEAPF